jgi:hypothetical protein
MTDDTIATVADALDTRPDALKPFVDEEITAAEILGRFGGAPGHLDLVETWLGGDAARVSETDGGATGDAHARERRRRGTRRARTCHRIQQ